MSACTGVLRARIAVAAAALALAGSWIACKTPLERAYGKSYRAHVAATAANPEAGKEGEAPRPDGTSTDAALHKFRTGERKADTGEEKSVINVDIGG